MARTEGFLSGLLSGFGGALIEKQQQKHEEELKGKKQLIDMHIKAIEAGDLDPTVGYPLVAQMITGSFDALRGDKKGKGKGGKGGGSPLEALMDPEALSGFLIGAHKSLSGGGSTPAGKVGPTGLPTAAVGAQSGTPEEGALPSRPTMPGTAPRSPFRSTAERQQQELEQRAKEVGATTKAGYSARIEVAQDLLKRGLVKTVDEGLERVGLKEPVPKAPPPPGSLAADVTDAISAAEVEKGSALTPAERGTVTGEVRARRANETRAQKSALGSGAEDERAKQVLARNKIDPMEATPEQIKDARKTAADELKSVEDQTLRNARLLATSREQATSTPDAGETFTGDKPDPQTANVVDAKTGLTPNALYQDALTFALQGKLPSLGLGSPTQVRSARFSIQNKAAAIADKAGTDLPTLQVEYRANATALNKIVPYYQMTEAFSETARRNLDLALKQSGQVARSGSKLANRYFQWAQGGLTPAAGLTEFETYVYTASREYAKVTAGAALSAAGLTDSANKEAQKLLNTAQSPQAFAAAVRAMKADMQNVRSSYAGQIAAISQPVAQFLGAAGAGTGPNVETWVIGPDGKLRKQ